MLNIKTIIPVAALVCGSFIVFAVAPQKASAQFIPPGSYKNICQQIYTKGTTLSAVCKPKSSSTAAATTKIMDYFECDGDISNNDGKLQCTRNTNSALMQKAVAAINAGYKNVFGYETPDYAVQKVFLKLLFEEGHAETFYGGRLGGTANLGLIDFFQTWLSKPENVQAKQSVVERALLEVHNWADPNRMKLYLSSKTGFQTIVLAEQKRLNADPDLRRNAIGHAYSQSMGRMPTNEEQQYWMGRQEYYSQIVAANRNFLYSANGAKDLRETVVRALIAKSKKTGRPQLIFTEENINTELTKHAQQKAIYKEMMGWK